MNIWKLSIGGGEPEQITAGQGDDADLDLSTNGQRMVFSSYRTNINLAEVSLDPPAGTTNRRWLTSDAARAELFPAYSPDGKRIAYFSARYGAENESIWVMGADGSNAVQLVSDRRGNVMPRWMADGETLLYGSTEVGSDTGLPGAASEFRRVSLSGGAPQTLPVRGRADISDISRDGNLAYLDPDDSVHVFNIATRQMKRLETIKGVSEGLWLVRWSPGGKLAYLVNPLQENDPDAGVWVYNFDGTPVQVFRGWALDFNWLADDELLVVQAAPDLVGRLVRVRIDGTPHRRMAASIQIRFSHLEDFLTTSFDIHPDHRRIVTTFFELHEADIGMVENVR